MQKSSQRGVIKHGSMHARFNTASSEKSKACSTLSHELFRASLKRALSTVRAWRRTGRLALPWRPATLASRAFLLSMTPSSAAEPASAYTQPPADAWWVVCLCAAWCNTCGRYREMFDAVACEWPGVRFEWVDIEDEAEVMGDVDVETFPTLLIADASGARFLGPLLPHASVLTRLIGSLYAAASGTKAAVRPETQALFERVRAAKR